MKSQQMVSEDRMINLPDHLVHHVLSFLSMEDLARLWIVSKKYKELCISIPSLNLDGIPYKNHPTKLSRFLDRFIALREGIGCIPYKHQPTKRAQFLNFLDRFIALRKGMETKSISIRWSFANIDSDEEYCVLTLLHNIVASKVESLALELILKKEGVFVLPNDVLHSESLMSLEVNLHGGCLKFPSSDGTCKIRSLCLKNITTRVRTIQNWVSSCCVYLKKLHLVNVRGIKNIRIKRSTLQHLRITLLNSTEVCNISVSSEMLEYIFLNWTFDTSIGKKLSVYAPKLDLLLLGGNLVSSYSLGELKHLKRAMYFLTPAPSAETNDLLINQTLSELLRSTCSTEVLALGHAWIQLLFKQGCLSTARLCNVRHLFIFITDPSDDLVLAIAWLLNVTPYLQSLSVKYTPSFGKKKLGSCLAQKTHGYTMGNWESQNLMFLQYIKEVTIKLHDNGDNELLVFIKYLLRNAKQLQMMRILESGKFSSETRREIIEYERASAAADVAFL